MTRGDVLNALRPLEPELKRLGLAKLYLFGSVARAEPDPRDVDLLYEVEETRRPGFFDLAHAMDRLEHVLGASVDLVERERLYKRIRPRIEAEMIEIY